MLPTGGRTGPLEWLATAVRFALLVRRDGRRGLPSGWCDGWPPDHREQLCRSQPIARRCGGSGRCPRQRTGLPPGGAPRRLSTSSGVAVLRDPGSLAASSPPHGDALTGEVVAWPVAGGEPSPQIDPGDVMAGGSSGAGRRAAGDGGAVAGSVAAVELAGGSAGTGRRAVSRGGAAWSVAAGELVGGSDGMRWVVSGGGSAQVGRVTWTVPLVRVMVQWPAWRSMWCRRQRSTRLSFLC
jgi:hypothetical protein